MNVVPTSLAGSEVPEKEPYWCPMCEAQSSTDPIDTGWVECPMIGRWICLGCCIDHQKPARAPRSAGHPLDYLFDELTDLLHVSGLRLRLACLRHQQALASTDETNLVSAIERALEEVLALASEH